MRRGTLVWVVGILLLAAGLRIAGLSFGRPAPAYTPSYEATQTLHPQTPLHPDSFLFVAHPLRMLLSGQLNNGFFENPSFLINLNYVIYAATGEGQALTHEGRESDNLRQYAPFRLYFMVRALSVLGGVALTAAAIATGLLLLNERTGFLAGLLAALAFPLVQHAHYATTSNLAAAFTLLSLYFALRAFKRLHAEPLLLAATFAGFAAGTRYNAAVVSVGVLLVGLYSLWTRRNWRNWLLVLLAFALFPLTFLLTTPAAVLDTAEFLHDLRYISNQYLTGTGVSPWVGLWQEWHYLAVFGLGIPATVLLFVAALSPFSPSAKGSLRWSVALLTLYIFLYSMLVLRTVRPANADQLLLPIIAPGLVLSAIGAEFVLRGKWRWIGGVVVLIAFPLALSVQLVNQLQHPDTREVMQAWVYEHVPPGSHILLIGPYNLALDEEVYIWSHNFNMEVADSELAQYDYAIISDALPHSRSRSGADVPDLAAVQGNPRVAWIERPQWAGYDWPLHTASYWHNPSLSLYCLHPFACADLSSNP